jgi:methyl coenzyme M reductase beta subunit
MSNTYSNLKFEIIEVGGNDGTWGPIVNTNVGTAIEQAIVGMATLLTADFTANVATLTLTNTNAAQNARAACLNITATLSAAVL